MSSDKTILVPVSFDEQSMTALKQSYNVAKLKEAKLLLMTVVKEGTDEGYVKMDQQKLDELAESVRNETSLTVETLLVKGKPFEEIVNAANRVNPLFIVMGYQGAISVTTFMGQNPFYVVRHAPCPVITIKGKRHYDGCRNIIVPMDLSKETREKVGRACEIAKLFKATVYVTPVLTSGDKDEKNKLIAYSKQVMDFIAKEGVTGKFHMIESENVTKGIIGYAKEIDADLIMIMTQQEMKLKDYVMGTSAMQIINTSDIPVMSVRPKEKKDTTSFAI